MMTRLLLVEKGTLFEPNGSVNNALPGVQGKALEKGHNGSGGAHDEKMISNDDEDIVG